MRQRRHATFEAVVLEKTSKLIAQCHERANKYARLAKTAATPDDREFYLNMELRWLFLARSYEVTDRLGSFTAELDRRRDRWK